MKTWRPLGGGESAWWRERWENEEEVRRENGHFWGIKRKEVLREYTHTISPIPSASYGSRLQIREASRYFLLLWIKEEGSTQTN